MRDEGVSRDLSFMREDLVNVGDLPYTQAMSSGLINTIYLMVGDSNVRQTAVTASTGKRLQTYFLQPVNYSNVTVFFESYYGTGNDIMVNPSGALMNVPLSNTSVYVGQQWDNGSQLSSASDVLSVRTSGLWPTSSSVESSGLWIIRYREL